MNSSRGRWRKAVSRRLPERCENTVRKCTGLWMTRHSLSWKLVSSFFREVLKNQMRLAWTCPIIILQMAETINWKPLAISRGAITTGTATMSAAVFRREVLNSMFCLLSANCRFVRLSVCTLRSTAQISNSKELFCCLSNEVVIITNRERSTEVHRSDALWGELELNWRLAGPLPGFSSTVRTKHEMLK